MNSLVTNDKNKNAANSGDDREKLPESESNNNTLNRSSRNSLNSEQKVSDNLREVATITTNYIIQNAIQGAIER